MSQGQKRTRRRKRALTTKDQGPLLTKSASSCKRNKCFTTSRPCWEAAKGTSRGTVERRLACARFSSAAHGHARGWQRVVFHHSENTTVCPPQLPLITHVALLHLGESASDRKKRCLQPPVGVHGVDHGLVGEHGRAAAPVLAAGDTAGPLPPWLLLREN